jgi:iduronate 2-sulfatase
MNSAYELKGCYDFEHVKHPSVAGLTEAESRLLKHGYYASVSYVDACLGKLMSGLADLGLDKNTIVVVWGDHGWKLGEHGSWCKQTNYRIDLQVPLMIRVPGAAGRGEKCEALVELVDLYPTLCDIAEIPIPEKMEGTSLKPLLQESKTKWKSAAFSQFHRDPRISPDGGRYMGFSIVTANYHYIQWRKWNHKTGVAQEKVVADELYDLDSDPDENNNIAILEKHKQLITQLSDQLNRGWRTAVPQ